MWFMNSVSDKEKLLEQVDRALDDIRPHLAVDGGNVEVVELTDDLTVRVKWLGNCQSCTMSAMTMKAGIEQAIKGKVPEVLAVEAINGIA
jgi:Fe-S cluster biogenesis protein NfuA